MFAWNSNTIGNVLAPAIVRLAGGKDNKALPLRIPNCRARRDPMLGIENAPCFDILLTP